ncbi:MAG: helix-turn-helix domain-containing protein [Marinisporobacter sp.]|jgi:transcriptional regulator with XRE-family HTH domain/desulfoferrodoxin (superoxide reductase-like protein)|nr:helix-turn-helix domain-containing protein [Marinisporobacter sp.]
MDCIKAGKLILSLRKEKNMTQKEIAEALNISDKTISKWERGLGCPDISLINELSNILGVNVEKLLIGDLSPNSKDTGNLKHIKFYVCSNCGDIIYSTGRPDISCCGRKLVPLAYKEHDKEHKITIDEIENDYYITIDHEMTKNHYISFVAYVSFDQVLLVKLYPEQNAEVRIPKQKKGKIYVYCSKHGLWRKENK